jgi:hypothetical protein
MPVKSIICPHDARAPRCTDGAGRPASASTGLAVPTPPRYAHDQSSQHHSRYSPSRRQMPIIARSAPIARGHGRGYDYAGWAMLSPAPGQQVGQTVRTLRTWRLCGGQAHFCRDGRAWPGTCGTRACTATTPGRLAMPRPPLGRDAMIPAMIATVRRTAGPPVWVLPASFDVRVPGAPSAGPASSSCGRAVTGLAKTLSAEPKILISSPRYARTLQPRGGPPVERSWRERRWE